MHVQLLSQIMEVMGTNADASWIPCTRQEPRLSDIGTFRTTPIRPRSAFSPSHINVQSGITNSFLAPRTTRMSTRASLWQAHLQEFGVAPLHEHQQLPLASASTTPPSPHLHDVSFTGQGANTHTSLRTHQSHDLGSTANSSDLPSQCPRSAATQRPRQGAWSSALLQYAIEAVERGGRIRTIARHYGIPASSLRDHLYGRTVCRKRGRQGVLTNKEEEELENYLLEMQNLGYPLTIAQLQLKVAEITQTRVTPFRDGIPGAGWLRWWGRRHPNLVLRSTQGLETNRAQDYVWKMLTLSTII